MAHILLIDDEVGFADCLSEELEANNHTIEYLERAEEGPDRLATNRFDVVLLDNVMPRMTGLEFLRALKERGIKISVVLMTSAPDSVIAISAMKFGAFDYVIKQGDTQSFAQELQGIIDQALKLSRPSKEVHVPGQPKPVSPDARKLVGNSRAMNAVYGRIGLFAESDDPVLILGETGTGKELVANALHNFSSRKDNSFIAMNCAAIPETLLESELFGHEKDAFTGAKFKKGLIEYADGGTLFLDEIGEMPIELQVKLLRVLQDRQIQRVGGRELISVNFRLLSATSRNLMQRIREGKFREDLFYRLNGDKLEVPPLRERREDIPELVDFFLTQTAGKAGRPKPPISQEAMEKILAYRWPGNVRELQSTIRCAFRLCRGSVILPEHVELVFDDNNNPLVVEESQATEEAALTALRKAIGRMWDTKHKDLWPHLRDMLERELLCVALERQDGNLSKVAEKLGMVWNTVSKRIKAYGLE